jgi:hypothetical protein
MQREFSEGVERRESSRGQIENRCLEMVYLFIYYYYYYWFAMPFLLSI